MKGGMRLKQGQVWVKKNQYFRITEWSRLTIKYKLSFSLNGAEERLEEVSKKEFCRLIKGAELYEEKQDVS
jgi:hypothetical protein